MKANRSDRLFDVMNAALMICLILLVLYPLYFIVIASFSNPDQVNAGHTWFYPRDITWEGYTRLFSYSSLWQGYANTILYTIVGTVINVSLTLTAGYALSRQDLDGRRIIMMIIAFTMFFSGGLIPTYLLVKSLGMVNTAWALWLPGAVSAFHIIISRTFFQTTIPHELLEAAEMDGCSNTRFFGRIVLPLSMPIVAVIVLFCAVSHWNSYFPALIYLRNEKLYPLQIILRDILIANESQSDLVGDIADVAAKTRIADMMKFGVIIVSSLPVLILYPFLQKYFMKGVMIGSLKG
ncbi:carbohydrate ABC transporter permease [Paenibacillus cymbidii]|uniref:carbohydrate ABC transporter permease n=1 Tax=Paenibacillus cymbidii TaxID=1639034 RepID=UPI001080A099|nr:carbohydrate ABC transporter permease [Paenibacillus cymbidii]